MTRRPPWLAGAVAAAVVSALGTTTAVASARTAPTADPRSRWLSSVSLDSPTDGWAVGNPDSFDSRPGNIVEKWDGSGWARVKSPRVTTFGFLSSTAAVSPTDAWAVGSTNGSALIERWNGSRWKVATSVPQANCYLLSVSASGPDDAWAVGFSFASFNEFLEHWDGTTWTRVDGAAPDGAGLTDVEATSAANAWASGYWGSVGSTSPLMEHWDGTAWTWSRPDNGVFPLGSSVNGITSLSARNAWVAGSYEDSESLDHPLVGHWNGKKWRATRFPDIDGSFSEVLALSTDDVWAAGQTGTDTLIEHWDGASWTRVDSPSAGAESVLLGLDATSADNVVAVGGFTTTAGARRPLIERWDGSAWTRVSPPPAD